MLFSKPKPRLTPAQMLATRPVRLAEHTLEHTPDGGAKVTVKLQARRWGWLLKLPEGASKTFELDSMGLLVWEACDGKTPVQQIIRKMEKKYKITAREAQVSIQAFLRTLAKKGLIALAVPEGKKKA